MWEFFFNVSIFEKKDIRDAGHIRKNDDGERCQEFYSGYGKNRNFCHIAEISAIWQKFLSF